jgi:tRNA dimethylallyltransferase
MPGLKMLLEFPLKPLLLVVGPTAVGKSKFAIQLAEKVKGEIISADSRSFYRGMDIGTAKPGAEDLEKIPHHLIDIAYPDETISLSLFIKLAISCIQEIHSRNRLPILVGGTGQYVRAILEGWRVPEGEPNNRLRAILEGIARELGATRLHSQLAVMDQDAARSIDPANVRRTIRALEVILTSGRKFSEQRLRNDSLFSTLILGLSRPREELYKRIDQRIDMMIQEGLEMETRSLLIKGYSQDLPALSAIGYKEMTMMINGQISREEAVVLMKRRTRVFIRRQSAWFRTNDPEIHWFNPKDNILENVIDVLAQVDNWKMNST